MSTITWQTTRPPKNRLKMALYKDVVGPTKRYVVEALLLAVSILMCPSLLTQTIASRLKSQKCEDCRIRPLEEIVTFHYTVCQKPWHCLPQKLDVIEKRLCRELHYQWYSYRSDLERSWGRNGSGTGSFEVDHFFGYCTGFGFKGYQQIALPYGKP